MTNGGRPGTRGPAELRPLKITPDFVRTADGSVFAELGGTRVLCSAQVVNGVPGWRRGSGAWLVDGRVLTPSQFNPRADSARGGTGEAGRQDRRDPTLHRTQPEGRGGLRGAGRAHHLHRLRRGRSRRRHTLCGRGRGLPRTSSRPEEGRGRPGTPGATPERLGGCCERGRGRRDARSRPGVRGRLRRRGRHERSHDGQG